MISSTPALPVCAVEQLTLCPDLSFFGRLLDQFHTKYRWKYNRGSQFSTRRTLLTSVLLEFESVLSVSSVHKSQLAFQPADR